MNMEVSALLENLPEDDADAMGEVVQRLEDLREREGKDFDFAIGSKILIRLAKDMLGLQLQAQPLTSWDEDYRAFIGTVNLQIADMIIARDVDAYMKGRKGVKTGYGYVGLDASEKKHLRELIKRIREKIDGSTVHERKKNAIRQRLLLLEKEIESSGTAIDNAMGLLFDITFAVKGGHKNLDGVIADAKDITRIIVERRAKEEKVTLPPSDADDMVSLPPPTAGEAE